MARPLVALLLVAVVGACSRPNRVRTRGATINSHGVVITAESCPSQRPASWPHSQFRVIPGSLNLTSEAQTGTLIFEVRLDSMPGSQGAQLSLRNQTVRRDMPYRDSILSVTVPAGRYYFHARRIGAQTLQDSIDVRSGFVDTVRILLGREMLCLVREY
jgi:hypothetical protein